jgi:hypothetical protein
MGQSVNVLPIRRQQDYSALRDYVIYRARGICRYPVIQRSVNDKMKKKSLNVMKSKFVGLPYSLTVAHQIESNGYGFIVSVETGTIRDVFEPGA